MPPAGRCFWSRPRRRNRYRRSAGEKETQLVNHQGNRVSQAGLTDDGDPGPFGAVHFPVNGADHGKARDAEQVEDQEGIRGERGEGGPRIVPDLDAALGCFPRGQGVPRRLTTFSLDTRPIIAATAACRWPQPRGSKRGAMGLPREAGMESPVRRGRC